MLSQATFDLHFSEWREQTGLVNPAQVQITEMPAEGVNGWRYSRVWVEGMWVSFVFSQTMRMAWISSCVPNGLMVKKKKTTQLMFTLEAFLLIEALHSSVKSFRSGLLELGLWAVTVHAKHLVWFLTPSRSLRRGKRGGPRQHLGPLWNQDSLEQRHFTHCFSKHLIEHLLCVRPRRNKDEKKSVLVLVCSVVMMSNKARDSDKLFNKGVSS